MDIKTAQQDVQTTFARGSMGQIISGLIWLASAALGTWAGERQAIILLVVGGMFIFPLTQLGLRLTGRPSSLPSGHPMNALAMQVAFTVPLNMLLVGAASLYNINWFYPAFMLVVGTHYMPFIFLYGMWEFAVLAVLLIFASVGTVMLFPGSFTFGGWFTGFVLLLFAFWVRRTPRPMNLAS
ncbi:MAG: hypothetical protein ABI621_05865 [Chloroflexota bacterium]